MPKFFAIADPDALSLQIVFFAFQFLSFLLIAGHDVSKELG